MNSTVAVARPVLNFRTLIAWPVMLFVSMLPDILLQELTGHLPDWLFGAKLVLICTLLVGSLFWENLRSLRLFFGVLLTLFALEWGVTRFFDGLSYRSWLAAASPFVQQVGLVQITRITTAILMTLAMLAVFRRFDRFFLVKGRLDAPAQPIPLILTRPPSWRILGPAIAGAMCLGLLVFVFAFGRPPALASLAQALTSASSVEPPLLTFVLLFAASNAFGEEMLYRAPWLAALEGPVGPAHALLMTAAYFGISHYYGVPYGALGMVMAFIPGWLNGKAMLETRGFFWAWFIHFWMDVVIFFFMALGAVSPSG
jgi:membrane protease YdiL (CAAX protease family)